MLFSNYRRLKRIGKHFVMGHSLLGAPIIVAGVCGAIGLAALYYLKKKADGDTKRSAGSCFGGVSHVRHSGEKRKAAGGDKKDRSAYTEDDFIVINEEDSAKTDEVKKEESKTGKELWVASVLSKTFHRPDCRQINRISVKNRIELKGSRDSLIEEGYKACSLCLGK